MQKLNISIKVIVMAAVIACATVTLASATNLVWDASSGTVDGYKVYYGTNASNPSTSVDVGNSTQYNIDTLPLSENTQYFFCVSAYNTAGESNPCPPVAYTPADTTPPAPPIGLVAD
jgi:hypothetical protein